jgi:hypothetical protein
VLFHVNIQHIFAMVAFATLTPSNALAKIALNIMMEDNKQVPQPSPNRDTRRVQHQSEEKVYDQDVRHERRHQQRVQNGEATEDTDPDSEPEDESLGMIWLGCYAFDLQLPPNSNARGWTMGTGKPGVLIDFALPTLSGARGLHARFAFSTNSRQIQITRMSSHANGAVSVNGRSLAYAETTLLNESEMNIQLASLSFVFKYEKHASTEEYIKSRDDYLTTAFMSVDKSNDVPVPTPVLEVAKVGQWSQLQSLGKGGIGKVFLANNHKDELVAIKEVIRDQSNSKSIDAEIALLARITEIVRSAKDENRERIVQLREVIITNRDQSSTPLTFDKVNLVFEPAAKQTFDAFMIENR